MVSLFGWGSSSSEASSSAVTSRSSSPAAEAVAAPQMSDKLVTELNPKGLKPCCACPETKSARDECFLRTAPEEADVKCGELLEAHKTCMRGFGFKV